jgi:hypothetical protein
MGVGEARVCPPERADDLEQSDPISREESNSTRAFPRPRGAFIHLHDKSAHYVSRQRAQLHYKINN